MTDEQLAAEKASIVKGLSQLKVQDAKMADGFHAALLDKADVAILAGKIGAHPKFLHLLIELLKLHAAKGADYSSKTDIAANLRAAEKLGLTPLDGVAVRLSDKFERFCNLLEKRRRGEGPAVRDEGLRDTAMDTAAYALWACIFLDEEQK